MQRILSIILGNIKKDWGFKDIKDGNNGSRFFCLFIFSNTF